MFLILFYIKNFVKSNSYSYYSTFVPPRKTFTLVYFKLFMVLHKFSIQLLSKHTKKLKGPAVCKIQTTGPDSIELYLIIQLSSTTSRF